MTKFSLLASVFLFSGCSTHEAVDFSMTQCEYLSDTALAIGFEGDRASRSLHISKEGKLVTFMGTTLQDMKWAAPYSTIKYFQVSESGILFLENIYGSITEFGPIDEDCRLKVQQAMGGLYKDNKVKQ